MKHFLLTFFVACSLGLAAQVNPHAIGLRGGPGNYGYGGEISYQHGFGEMNRLELDFGWRGNYYNNGYRHLGITGMYHWVWNLTDGLNWYFGPGAQVGLFSSKNSYYDDGITLNIGVQLGLEYDFNTLAVPFLVSLDVRPMFGFLNYYSGFGYGSAFSVRYTF